MRIFLLFFVMTLLVSSCRQNCYRCTLQNVCAKCYKTGDTLRFCAPATLIADSLNRNTEMGYACHAVSGLEYGTQICDHTEKVKQMEADHWICAQ